MPPPADLFRRVTARQDGAVTVANALEAGLSPQQVRTLQAAGWASRVHGVLVEPHPRDAFRADLRAALLSRPHGVACRASAARVHKLSGLALWTPAETPTILLPTEFRRNQRSGMRTYGGFQPGDSTFTRGFSVTTLMRTFADLTLTLSLDDLICALDSALHLGWTPGAQPMTRRQKAVFAAAMALTEKRSESALETHLRLLVVRAGVGPEDLQFRLFRPDGSCFARIDLAWPSCRLAVEADGRKRTTSLSPTSWTDSARTRCRAPSGTSCASPGLTSSTTRTPWWARSD